MSSRSLPAIIDASRPPTPLFHPVQVGLKGLLIRKMNVRRRTGPKPWIALASMIVMVGLYAWLIPQFGAMGAAFAILGGYMFHALTTWVVSQRVFRVDYEYGRLAAMLAGGVAVVLLAGRLDLGIMNIPAKLALWASWPVGLWITGLVSKDEKAMVVRGLLRILQWSRSQFTSPTDESDVPVANPGKVR